MEAVLLTSFVLIRQNAMDLRSERRNHLDLQINLLAEKEATSVLKILREIADHLKIDVSADAEREQLAEDTAVESIARDLDPKRKSPEAWRAAAPSCCLERKAIWDIGGDDGFRHLGFQHGQVIEALERQARDHPRPEAGSRRRRRTASGRRGDTPVLTTAQGGPVSDDQNSLKVGPRGPTLLEDFHFREKIFHFDHERIPERVVHARGYGAHGFFENYKSLSKYTRADLFQRAGERTPAFVRFSTVAGSKGSADLARDVRGFAVKLYTQEGNWDIVGNNIPVFFIQDAIKFPDIIHAVKEEPDCAFPQAQSAHDNFWDFISLTPESMHMIMWVMSDRAIPRSFRFMEGFGVHTFRLVNAKGESTFVKFHWKPKLGLQSVLWNEAVKINGADPDFHRRDLWNAIQTGNFPEWELQFQLFDQDFADSFEFDVLDPDQADPGGNPAADPGRPAGARPHAGQLLRRNRAGRVHDPERAARHRLLQRPAAAGPQLLLSRHAAEAARQPELHAYSDQCAEMPVPSFPAGRPYGDAQSGRACELSAQLVRRRPAGIAAARLHAVRRGRAGSQAPAARGKLCRSLQPGAAVLHQPDAAANSSTSRRR